MREKLKNGTEIKIYDKRGSIDTFTLKRDSADELQLYDKFNNELSEEWNFGTFLDEKYTFEIVEEKIPDEVKNALGVLNKYCKGRHCSECAFFKNKYDPVCCGLMGNNPYYNYIKYVGE